jgi:phosphodiesterase/alkaline phosphatase D-like protein
VNANFARARSAAHQPFVPRSHASAAAGSREDDGSAALAAPTTSRIVHGQPHFAAYPFTLGVASGDPVADGFVLWTRLAPDPLNGGGMPPEAVPVRWEVARDPRFLDIVGRGHTLAVSELGHSVHVDVTGLEPDRWYYYRFIAGGEVSPIGRTRTFPPIGAPADPPALRVRLLPALRPGLLHRL